jgi:hypothetical protein
MTEGKESFFWVVPAVVRRIVISPKVTVTGGFRVGLRSQKNPLRIEGMDRKTSVIFGTAQPGWAQGNGIPDSDKWKYGSVSVLADATVYISHLTSLNPRGYHISGYAKRSIIHVNDCDILDTRPGDQNNSDGFVGSAGSSIRRCLFSTSDDSIKVYHDITIEDVTIEQKRNGAPLQLGWGGETDKVIATVSRLRILGASGDGRYNMAPISWEAGNGGERTLILNGLQVRIEGVMYLENESRWVPAGIFEIKPSTVTLNVIAKEVDVSSGSFGIMNATGRIDICGTSIRTNRYSCPGL